MAKKKKRTLEEVLAQDKFIVTQSGGTVAIGNPLANVYSRTLSPAFGGASPIPLGRDLPATNQLTDAQVGGLGALGSAGCALITNPTARALCIAGVGVGTTILTGAAAGAVGAVVNGSRRESDPYYQQVGSPTGGPTLTSSSNCPAGWKPNGTGGCMRDDITQYLPGDVGRIDTAWTPVYGRYGVGATPIGVQRVQRVCPPRSVLGDDGVCYEHLPRTYRAHNPGRKPLLTGGDMNALARARALQKTISKINTRFGKKKPCVGKTSKRK